MIHDLARNRQALRDYHILETFEAGLVLTGSEVKSAKGGNISLKGTFANIHNGELYLLNAHISPYKHASAKITHEPTRSRKLLLHRHEIKSLIGKMKAKGLTVVPLRVYTKRGNIKVALGIARGKKTHDKREDIKKRDDDRAIARAMRRR